VIVILLLAGAIAGIVFFLQRNKSSAATTLPPSTNAIPGSITNLTTDTSVTPTAQPPPKPVKSLDDLKSSEVIFEKTKGSSLVYASGTITNASDFQRFGIRVELDVFNPKGARIGSAQDYTDLIEPRQEWRFRALLPDPKAASAKIASIKEDQ
jgi:hypothetical protein